MKFSGVLRAVLVLAYCVAAFVVLADLSTKYHWDGVGVRAPVFGLAALAYSSNWLATPAGRLWVVSLIATFLAAAIVILPAPDTVLLRGAETVLAAVALAFFILATVAWGWSAYRRWRAERNRLRASYPSALDRIAGGF